MNMLVDLLPTKVTIDGIEYKINCDFRTSILFELLMQDVELNNEEKLISALDLYYPELPANINQAIEKMLWFYRCGKDEVDSKNNNKGTSKAVNIYSYEYDDDYIYSAFLYQYNIDLQDINYLHWWKFKAMFKALKEDNMIVKIMGYRTIELSKIKDKEQRKYYKGLKKIYELPKMSMGATKELEELNKVLLNGGDLSKVL